MLENGGLRFLINLSCGIAILLLIGFAVCKAMKEGGKKAVQDVPVARAQVKPQASVTASPQTEELSDMIEPPFGITFGTSPEEVKSSVSIEDMEYIGHKEITYLDTMSQTKTVGTEAHKALVRFRIGGQAPQLPADLYFKDGELVNLRLSLKEWYTSLPAELQATLFQDVIREVKSHYSPLRWRQEKDHLFSMWDETGSAITVVFDTKTMDLRIEYTHNMLDEEDPPQSAPVYDQQLPEVLLGQLFLFIKNCNDMDELFLISN